MTFKRIAFALAALLLLAILGVGSFLVWQSQAGGDPDFFEREIAAFEATDSREMPPPNGIVFTGSSSIRLWDTLADDMAPLPVLNRGFGGAHMEHVVHNAHRIVTPYEPLAVVVFVGGNDIGSGKSASQVAEDFRSFLEIVRAELPDTDIWLLSMKPSKLRWDKWPIMQELDVALRAFAQSDEHVRFVNTGEVLLGPDGTPDDVYIFDGLHLNAVGYSRWTSVLRPLLMAQYGPTSE
ncbi:GDSL-type esterase/lipase family protein [Myxococcota bacterium]|nr:GDSL-type esterase/lipase family protein [Myxococcota bacterium]